jgi:hypothetical protein
VTVKLLTIWRCDGPCDASAPEHTAGWTDAGRTHGCPDHGTVIAAHKANVTYVTRGRGRSEKTTWYLTCACGWKPVPFYETYSTRWLESAHLLHVAEQFATSEVTG